MTYKEFFMQFDTIDEVLYEAKNELAMALVLNPDRAKSVKNAVEEVLAEKFNKGGAE